MDVPAIYFKEVCLDFEGVSLLDNFCCTIPTGKCSCLLGPSGCGKSTILGLISGRDLPYTGEIVFPSAVQAVNQISWMSQDDLLLPWLNVLDNVVLGAKLRNEADTIWVNKAERLLGQAGLADVVSNYPNQLSGGMRQRVALLRTLVEDRPVLLMDEPFSALDALTRIKLQDLAVRMTRGKTVLLVTHDPMEALRISDRIIVLGGSPVRVEAVVDMESPAPRDLQQPEVSTKYARLLKLLLGEGEV
ncbi:ABC transporter ATP-binding protein [Desulfopila sp. IMCC35008]|uniref:ABC transporter ATP-binding protein n=1 Tax=Desulfopila sp. IMCC35008 TaxID=2653858 RepID=UPI00197AD504|nr:ABC transporter ATP-binding protein [Desulfopila sp. IMCC35008]